MLNFGHTIAHGIEHATDYAIKHGEAVAYGMVLEAYIQKSPIDELIKCLKLYGLLQHGDLNGLHLEKCLHAICHDKKNRDDAIYMVDWHDIADVDLLKVVTVNQIEQAFSALKDIL